MAQTTVNTINQHLADYLLMDGFQKPDRRVG